MGVNIKATSGPVVERPGDLAALLTNLEQGDVLFIDEIHRLNHVVEEVLYPAMEDYQIDIMVGQGPSARVDQARSEALHADRRDHALGPADLAAARPLRPYSRLDFYDTAALARILKRSAAILSVPSKSKTASPRSPAARAARRASPTACCAGCATTPR